MSRALNDNSDNIFLLWPWTDLWPWPSNWATWKLCRYKPARQISRSVVISLVRTHRHTHRTDCCTWTTNVVGSNSNCVRKLSVPKNSSTRSHH